MSGERHEPGEVQAEEHELDLLLEYLTRTRGFSFGSYKRPSLARRFRRRMQEIGITEFADYRDYLEVHPDEYPRLFDTLLINVTAFLRDPVAWATLRDRVLPALLAGKEPGSTVRAWCAGCATGQDAYSLAMVLCEVMGTDEVARRVKIYGTDIDDAALTVARQGVYTSRDLESVPRDMVERYFERVNSSHVFRKDLRRCVIFGRHDLNADAPISKLDIVVCRNTLMYFNAEAQSHILDRFHFGLTDSGVLMLGKAETLLTHVDTFTAVDLKNRIFIKTPAPRATGGPPVEAPAPPSPPAEPRPILGTAFDNGPVPQFVVDSEGRLAFANDRARALLGLRAGDLGRPVRELELSYRPVELRPLIEQVRTERLPVDLNDVTWAAPHLGGSPLRLRVQVVPLLDFAGNHLGVAVSASDVTAYHLLEEELQKSNRELETAYEELQSTNEELETTNEELQSTIEELETTNEELQSTNEELERR
jgi:two-component system, chemotaxis family, CheB/CheR fusion protein